MQPSDIFLLQPWAQQGYTNSLFPGLKTVKLI